MRPSEVLCDLGTTPSKTCESYSCDGRAMMSGISYVHHVYVYACANMLCRYTWRLARIHIHVRVRIRMRVNICVYTRTRSPIGAYAYRCRHGYGQGYRYEMDTNTHADTHGLTNIHTHASACPVIHVYIQSYTHVIHNCTHRVCGNTR